MTQNSPYDVIISGGGPIGLFLGCRLIQLGLNICILEKNPETHSHSKSIGIHPPSLEMMAELGLADKFTEHGKPIRRGIALSGPNQITGLLNFESCKPPYNYILTIPQFQTENILADKILQFSDDILVRGAEVYDVKQNQTSVTVSYHHKGSKQEISSNYLIAADGKNSAVREIAEIPFHGNIYPFHYAMGDFEDNTPFGDDAAIYTSPLGLVESFPLPNGLRRWVAQLPEKSTETTTQVLCSLIEERTGIRPDSQSSVMLSTFKAERMLAERLFSGRIILAGDAAHVVSPIGGQGMNLGWMDAWLLADIMAEFGRSGIYDSQALENYQKLRTTASLKAMKRAEFNMKLGHKTNWPLIQKTLLWMLLNFPTKHLLARRFTMRGLS